MRWSTFRGTDGTEHVGIWRGGRLHQVPGVVRLIDLLGDDGTVLAAEAANADETGLEPDEVELLAPIPRPPSIRDFMAFEEHVVTSNAAIGLSLDPLWYEQPVFYFSNPAATCGPYDDVAVSPGSAAFDYELEVAAVVGRGGSDIAPGAGTEHIAGFVLFCDWSARDLQGEEMKLHLGPAKGKDSANGFGPWLLTPDELIPRALGYDVPLAATVNGKSYSAGNLSSLYWSFGEMIAYASRGTKLVPGDIIGSGTVGTGCILELSRVHGIEQFPYLRPDDRVVLDGGPLGAIEAQIVAGPDPISLREGR